MIRNSSKQCNFISKKLRMLLLMVNLYQIIYCAESNSSNGDFELLSWADDQKIVGFMDSEKNDHYCKTLKILIEQVLNENKKTIDSGKSILKILERLKNEYEHESSQQSGIAIHVPHKKVSVAELNEFKQAHSLAILLIMNALCAIKHLEKNLKRELNDFFSGSLVSLIENILKTKNELVTSIETAYDKFQDLLEAKGLTNYLSDINARNTLYKLLDSNEEIKLTFYKILNLRGEVVIDAMKKEIETIFNTLTSLIEYEEKKQRMINNGSFANIRLGRRKETEYIQDKMMERAIKTSLGLKELLLLDERQKNKFKDATKKYNRALMKLKKKMKKNYKNTLDYDKTKNKKILEEEIDQKIAEIDETLGKITVRYYFYRTILPMIERENSTSFNDNIEKIIEEELETVVKFVTCIAQINETSKCVIYKSLKKLMKTVGEVLDLASEVPTVQKYTEDAFKTLKKIPEMQLIKKIIVIKTLETVLQQILKTIKNLPVYDLINVFTNNTEIIEPKKRLSKTLKKLRMLNVSLQSSFTEIDDSLDRI